MQFRGRAWRDDTRPEEPLQVAGRLTVDNADLARLATFGGPRFQSLGGRALGEFDLHLNGLNSPVEGQGRLVLQGVRWDRTPLTDLAESGIVLTGDSVRFTKASARAAGGMVRRDLILDLERPGEGAFSVAVDQISLRRLPTAWRTFLAGSTGNLAASFQGRLGETWQGAGQVRFVNGNVAGVPVRSVRAPVDWVFAPRTGAIQTRVRLTSARVARGRVSGDIRARWSGRLDLKGDVKVFRADVRPLTKAAPGLDELLGGTLSGTVEFKGTNVRSLRDLSGVFNAELLHSHALMLPVLEALTTAPGLGSSSRDTFSKTEAKGRFSRGILQIDRMTLESPHSHMFIEGKINHRGSLDLEVTADANQVVASCAKTTAPR